MWGKPIISGPLWPLGSVLAAPFWRCSPTSGSSTHSGTGQYSGGALGGTLCRSMEISLFTFLSFLALCLVSSSHLGSPQSANFTFSTWREQHTPSGFSLPTWLWKFCLGRKLGRLYGLAHLILFSQRSLPSDSTFPLSYMWKPLFNIYFSDFFLASLGQKTKSGPWYSTLPGSRRSLIHFVFSFLWTGCAIIYLAIPCWVTISWQCFKSILVHIFLHKVLLILCNR